MRFFCLVLLWLSLLASPRLEVFAQAHLDTALAYIGTLEVGFNRGPEIERFQRSVSIKPGSPYCAAFVSYCLKKGGAAWPAVRSGLAQHFIGKESIRASHVLRGAKVPAGAIVIWRKGNGWKGHAGFVISWVYGCGETVEANTSPGSYGSQQDGDGVWRRRRCIEPGNYFRIVSFMPVRYE